MKSPYLLVLLCFIGVLGLDLASKAWVLSHWTLAQSVPLWQGVFHLTYVRNTGAAFSLLAQYPQFLTALAAVMVAAILGWLYLQRSQAKPLAPVVAVALGCVLGGAIGNLRDRLLYGAVIDFIDVRVIHYPIFNVADTFICIGVSLLVFYYVWQNRHAAG